MRRYPVVIGVTAAGLAGVLSFHSHSGTVALGGGSAGSGTTPSRNHSSHTGSSKNTPATPPPTTPAAGTSTSKSATGTLEQYGYGQLSIRVTMSGGKITGLAVATLKTAESYSQQLADQVIPILQREVLSAQSARINGLSGATYTSEAYAYSVQSALDKLHK